MRFVTFQQAGRAPEPGIVVGDRAIGLSGAGFPDLLSLISGGQEARKKAEGWAANPDAGAVADLAAVKLLAPIPKPPKIICVGLNYLDHAKESKQEVSKAPTIFAKFPTAVIGPRDSIVLPKASTRTDYEAEFAFVVGKGGRYIDAGRWREHVFGYMNLNDVSARDFQMATSQWMMGKTFDTFAPMGPWLVSDDEVPDPHDLDISLALNGQVMQSSNTRNLIFKIPDLISFLSSVFTLEPGDVVATGTPAGVGAARRPPVYLKAGDEVAVRITGLGELHNPVVAELP